MDSDKASVFDCIERIKWLTLKSFVNFVTNYFELLLLYFGFTG